MTEKRFKLIPNTDITYSLFDLVKKEYVAEHLPIRFEGICDILNELNEENKKIKTQYDNLKAQRDEFYRGARENANNVGQLEKENEELKQSIHDWQGSYDELYEDNLELEKENKEFKSILQDMGLIMSNEEVKNVRDEIASKLIKQICKENGVDVDINTENGFTISYKRWKNDRK